MMRAPSRTGSGWKQTHSRRRAHARGSIIVTSYFVLVSLLGLVVSQTMRSLAAVRLESRFVAQRRALHLAEAGVDHAAWLIATGQILPASNAVTCQWNPSTSCPADSGALTTLVSSGKLEAAVTGPETTAPSPMDRMYRIVATGTFPFPNGVSRTLEAVVERRPIPFRRAVFAGDVSESIFLNAGAVIDSYDSSAGPYGGVNVASNGDVETNRDLGDGMWVSAGSEIRGQAFFSGLPPGTTMPPGGGSITGAVQPQPDPEPSYHPVTPPGSPTCDLAHTFPDVPLFADTTYADAGPYCFSSLDTNGYRVSFPNATSLYVAGRLDLWGGGQLIWNRGVVQTGELWLSGASGLIEVTDKTDWYVTGRVLIQSEAHVNANTTMPDKFRLYVKPQLGTDTVNVASSGTQFYGLIYAPTMEVRLTSGVEMFGAVIANRFVMDGLAPLSPRLHYDQALAANSDFPGWAGGSTATVRVRGVRF